MQTAAKSVAIPEALREESWEASISAWMDGEAADDFLPELASPHGRQAWDTYHLIGDVLRNTDLALSPSPDFQARLAKALEAELPIVAPVAARRRSALRLSLSGLAVVAAVATVVWVAQPYLHGSGGEAQVLADASGPAPDDTGLGDYLEAHRQMAGPSAIRQVSFDTGMGR
ncbi:sigma-E factor negative regulatory protein [Bordetella sp. 2513F-2]